MKQIFKKDKKLSVDKFFERVLYDNKAGYYSKKIIFGKEGDYITSPMISVLFGEMITIWLITIWESIGKPNKFNIVELGPGNGELAKVIYETSRGFKEFNDSISIFLFEKSPNLRTIQKKILKNKKVKWIKSFSNVKDGPIIFIGNEFFDSIPIKQFKKNKGKVFEKYYFLNEKNIIKYNYTAASYNDIQNIKKYKCLKKSNFIEYPKIGFELLERVTKKISVNTGGILLIDYGYIDPLNKSSIQSLLKHKKNKILKNLRKADITYLVNFKLLKEFFENKKLKNKNIVTQGFFLKRLGIQHRANELSKKMSFKDKASLFLRLKRLIHQQFMGELFKVNFCHNFKNDNIIGFN
tara:strand:- start:3493 stop:4548 length:1056 start_codon:yes stop_codon:yes gene_type:complete